MVEVKEFDKLLEMSQRLRQLNDKMSIYDIPRVNFSTILENEKLLAIYHKDWSLIAKQINFVRKVREEFLKDYENNPDLAISRIRLHLKELIELMREFDAKEISKLELAFRLLSRVEISELDKCMEDLNRWPNYRLTNRIDFFVERLVIYLKGGVSRYDGTQFLGLYTHFRDAELKDTILKSGTAKKLLFYKKEQEFFSKARDAILRSRKEGRWEEFYDFYKNLKKGRNYIKMIRETFGNEEFANLLESFIEKVHEDPTAWGEDLKELSYKLEDIGYQNRYVIEPAKQTLLLIFNNVKDRIFRSKERFKEVEDVLGRLEDNIKDRIGRLRKAAKKLKEAFDNIDNEAANEMGRILPAIMDLMTKVGMIPEIRMGRISKTLDLYYSWLERYKSIVQRISGAAFFAAVKVDDVAVINAKLLTAPLIQQPFESYINLLEQRTDRILIPKLQEVVNFIRSHDNEFNRPVSNTTELLPEVKDLTLKAQNDLIAELKKEGFDFTKPMYG